MKEQLLILLLFFNNIIQAQPSVFVGIGGGAYATTLQNSADNSLPNHLLKTISRFGLSQGFQIGYRVGTHFELSIKPNHQVYKCTIMGTPDTGFLRNYSAKLQLNYLNLPINLNYAISFSNRMGVNAEVGFNIGYLSKYIEDMEAMQLSFASPGSLYKFHSNFTGKKGYSEFYENGYRKVDITTDKERYQKFNLGLIANIGVFYNISDKFRLFVSINSITGLSDIENKTIVEATYSDIQGVHKQSYALWSNYYRYFASNAKESRPPTHTMALGLGLGINYYFNGGLLSKKLHD
jgi:hypothetical protein